MLTDIILWVAFCILAGLYDAVMYHNFSWRDYVRWGLHLPHVIAWPLRAVAAAAVFTPGWSVAEWGVLCAAGLVLPFFHTGAYGWCRRYLDPSLTEHGWFMKTTAGGDGWRRYFPDRNPWVRLCLAVAGLVYLGYESIV